jgi:hypothetical protein
VVPAEQLQTGIVVTPTTVEMAKEVELEKLRLRCRPFVEEIAPCVTLTADKNDIMC